jgi:hypothetical protein
MSAVARALLNVVLHQRSVGADSMSFRTSCDAGYVQSCTGWSPTSEKLQLK